MNAKLNIDLHEVLSQTTTGSVTRSMLGFKPASELLTYPTGYLYVTDGRWMPFGNGYRIEDDELLESEANQLGIYRTK